MIAFDSSAELAIPVQLSKSDISESVKLRAIRTPFFWLVPLWVVIIVQFVLASSFHTPQWYAWVWALIAGLISLFFLLRRSRNKNKPARADSPPPWSGPMQEIVPERKGYERVEMEAPGSPEVNDLGALEMK